MKRTWLILLALVVITLVAGGLWYYPKYQEQAAAPSFSKMSYAQTVKNDSCKTVITDATCYHYYVYSANGTEEDLAQSAIDDFAKQGYTPTKDSNGNDASVQCSTNSSYASGAAVDSYSFANAKAEQASVVFIPPNDKITKTNKGSNFGCTNQSGAYKVLVYYANNQR